MTKDFENQMSKSVAALESKLSELRAGRAHPGLLAQIKVNAYGSDVPLSQVATVSVPDSRTLAIKPFDKQQAQAIEKAIMTSDLGMNPTSTGDGMIRLAVPPLTEETRKDLVKQVKKIGEEIKVSIRKIRQDENKVIESQLKDKSISENDSHGLKDAVQKATDEHAKKVDKLLRDKEAELMKV